MAIFYKNFKEMMKLNKGTFDLLKDKKSQEGLYRAIWDSRDTEMDNYKKKGSIIEIRNEEYKNNILNQGEKISELETTVNNQHKELEKLKIEEDTSIMIIEGIKKKLIFKENEITRILKLYKRCKPLMSNLKIEISEHMFEIKKLKRRISEYEKSKKELIFQLRSEKNKTKDSLLMNNEIHKKSCEAERQYSEELKGLAEKLKESTNQCIQEKENSKKIIFELRKKNKYIINLKSEIEKVRLSTMKYQRLNHKMEVELFKLNVDLKDLEKYKITSSLLSF
jgi:chromosome segregation ATPase